MPDAAASPPGSMGIVYSMVGNSTSPLCNIQFTQATGTGVVGTQEFVQVSAPNANNHYYSSSPQQPSSPQAPSPQGPSSPTMQAQGSPQQQLPHSPLAQQDPTFGLTPSMTIANSNSQQATSKIPDIVLTGNNFGIRGILSF